MGSETARSRRALVAEAAVAFEGSGTAGARREAQRLWCDVIGEGGEALVLQPDTEVQHDHAAAYRRAVHRRLGGEPLAHVSGWTGFRHLTLHTDRRALIPRPETEGLVERVLSLVPGGRIVDIGTGTGCVALSLALEGRYEQVVGLDLSPDALEVARKNRARTGGCVELVHGDVCDPLASDTLDAVVSNPPYLTAAEFAGLDESVRAWEPRMALESGEDGLGVIGRLLDDGLRVVRPGGWLVMEIDCTRAAQCARRAGASGWTDVAVHADLFGRERYLLARRSDAS